MSAAPLNSTPEESALPRLPKLGLTHRSTETDFRFPALPGRNSGSHGHDSPAVSLVVIAGVRLVRRCSPQSHHASLLAMDMFRADSDSERQATVFFTCFIGAMQELPGELSQQRPVAP
jgi:hypothetical protein